MKKLIDFSYGIRPFLLLLILLSLSHIIVAQTRIAVYGLQVNKSVTNAKSIFSFSTASNKDALRVQVVPEKIISYFSSDDDFIVIDRKNQALIKQEIELQKSESFMDGYIVDQGKSEGVDMICTSFFDEATKMLTIKIFDVADGKIFCLKERALKSNWGMGVRALEKDITVMLHEISSSCFDKGFPVVRITKEKKGKAKEILVLAGFAQRLKVGYKMEIVQLVEENIAGIKKMRKQKIGIGRVERIEDDNFSTLEIDEGRKEIYEAINNGVNLECKLISN